MAGPERVMAGWKRIVRGIIGTGLTFAAGVGAIVFGISSVVVLSGTGSFGDALVVAGRFSVAGFVLGAGFAGILAIAARSRGLAKISIPRFAALGAGAGLLYFAVIATNGVGRWSVADAIVNFGLLTVLGGGFAAATLKLARRGRGELESGDEPRLLREE
jgi:hypothetical protein